MHLSARDLIGFLDGSAAAEAAERAERHLEGCPACRERAGELRRVVEAVTGDRLLEPSEAAMAAVIRRFARSERHARLPEWARGLRDTVARIVFDSLAQPELAFAGARTASVARRLRFEAGDLELDVLIEPVGARRRLTGQLLALGVGGSPVSDANYLVSVAGNLEFIGETDEHGELVSDLRSPGEIEIHVAARRTLALFRIPEHHAGPTGN